MAASANLRTSANLHFAYVGHLYDLNGRQVIALEEGPVVAVREVSPDEHLGLGQRHRVHASWLRPLPMKYFHNQTPLVMVYTALDEEDVPSGRDVTTQDALEGAYRNSTGG